MNDPICKSLTLEHPDASQLVAFSLGILDEQELEAIATHVESCSVCCERIRDLSLNDELIRKLQSLRNEQTEVDLLAKRAAWILARASEQKEFEQPNLGVIQYIHQYRIIDEVGRGGMGIVYKAEDMSLGRMVAVKVMLAGPFANSVSRIRFRMEAELAASLRDPHIIQVYEIGEFRGQPFVVYEWIEGGSLVESCRQRRYPPREAASLMEKLARAVQLAHSQGVIHRDLKPANILLSGDTPKIADFGLACRWGSEGGLTMWGALMGTPEYMSPEQARGDFKNVGPATDIYALGAILYELLTGQPPFLGNGSFELLQAVADDEPKLVRSLVSNCPEDLEVIASKCLNKVPTSRYRTAESLAEDLRRFLCGEPISARPIGKIQRMWLWCKRFPLIASLIVLICLLLMSVAMLGGGVAYIALHAAEQSEKDARIARDAERLAEASSRVAKAMEEKSRRNAYNANALLLENAWNSNESHRFQRLLQMLEPEGDLPDLRRFEWYYWHNKFENGPRVITSRPNMVSAVTSSKDGKRLAIADLVGEVTLFDATSSKLLGRFQGESSQVDAICFCQDEKLLATGDQTGAITVWSLDEARVIQTFVGHREPVCAIKSLKNELISAAKDGTIRRWDLANGLEKATYDLPGRVILNLDISDDETRMVFSDGNGNIHLWELEKWKEIAVYEGYAQAVPGLDLSRDGRYIAFAGNRGIFGVLDTSTGKARFEPVAIHVPIQRITFDCSDSSILTAGVDSVIRKYDASSGTKRSAWMGHRGVISSLVSHPHEPSIFFSAGADAKVRIWNSSLNSNPIVLRNVQELTTQFSLLTLTSTVAVPGSSREVRLIDQVTGETLSELQCQGPMLSALFSHDGNWLAAATTDQDLVLWDLRTSPPTKRVQNIGRPIHRLAFSLKDDLIFLASGDGSIVLCDTVSMEVLQVFAAHDRDTWSVQVEPKSGKLFSTGFDGKMKVWDWEHSKLERVLFEHPSELFGFSFSPSGNAVAVASEDGTVQIRDMHSGLLLQTLTGHGGPVRAVCYSPDGDRLATASYDRTVGIWDTHTGQQIITFDGHPGDVMEVAFSADGQSLVSVANGGEMRIWRAPH